jgi:NAD(P)-dependent dehydrogenase (short-subunit alcohol dehydrogenase family)
MKPSAEVLPSILITGGTRGIGRAIALRFLKEGFYVFTCGSSEKSVESLRAEDHSGRLQVEKVNLENRDELLSWVARVEEKAPSLNILINNAGIFLPGSIETEEEGVFDKLISLNLAASYHASRTCLPMLRKADKAHIFTVCSTASIMAYPNGGSYCISKFGLLGMTKVLREELKPSGIRVTALILGAVNTDSWAGSGLPAERFINPDDVAETVFSAWSLSSGSVAEEILMRPQLGDI